LIDLHGVGRNGNMLISATSNYGKSGLKSCDTTQASFAGPLVPGQDDTSQTLPSSSLVIEDQLSGIELSSRAGFAISYPTNAAYWAKLLGSGWYLDWSVLTYAPVKVLEHWQMVRVHEDCISPSLEQIQQAAALAPGQVWIIGNEPDVIWQDNVTAARYASTYHDLYLLIKSSDPTAQIAGGGISQATPLRLQYLDQVLHTYKDLYAATMPVDWWTMHGYVLREEKGSWGVDIPPGMDVTQGELRQVSDHGRIDLFASQVRSFRQWMTMNGYQNTPLALTEFGILMPASYGFPAEQVASYLEQSFDWLHQTKDESIGYPSDEYRLVQKWAWFSISDPTYSTSDLGNLPNGSLTILGEKFHDIVLSMEP
jgi:hypothetical protein